MSDHVTTDIIYEEYRTSVLHTNVLLRDQDDHYPTEWFVFRGDEQLATGWGQTPREADERAKEALDRFRSAILDSKSSQIATEPQPTRPPATGPRAISS